MTPRIKVFALLALLASCGGGRVQTQAPASPLAAAPPRAYTYKVVATYPHDPTSYTQGLLWHEGHLWEGTGLNGQSALMQVRLADGKILRREALDARYFGEGLALLGGKFYQLTWQDGVAIVWDAATLKEVRRFDYAGEGWGLATDGAMLYMSDGTENIHVVDPQDFSRKRTIPVYTDKGPVPYLNELEWVEGELWANVYTTMVIVRIDPLSGHVKGIIDLSGILPEADITPQTDVLNGIAYDAATKRVFVTGKNWTKLFEIEVLPK